MTWLMFLLNLIATTASLFPWLVTLPFLQETIQHIVWKNYRSHLDQRMIGDVIVPVILVCQLALMPETVGALNTLLSLSVYYIFEIYERNNLSPSILFHHKITVVMAMLSAITIIVLQFFGSEENYHEHLYCTRLVLLSEVSTIFYNIKTLMPKKSVWKTRMTQLFFITFILCRFGPAYHILNHYPYTLAWLLYCVFIALNTYWVAYAVYKRLPGVIVINTTT